MFRAPTLRIGNYVLRPFRPADARAWYAYLADPRVTEHTSWPAVTPASIATLVERLIADYTSRTSIRWAIARADDDSFIGSCGYTSWWAAERRAEIAYDLDPAHWGRGIMTAAIRAAVDWALRVESLERIEAFVMTTNVPSIAVVERSGFRREALLRDYRSAHGILRDFYRYSLRREDVHDARK